MKRFLCTVILFAGIITVSGQGFITERGLNLNFSGFIKNDFILDSRRNVEAVDGLITWWPMKPVLDENGNDINAVPSARMLSISSRFTTRLSGLTIGSANVGALLEIDFTGGDAANSIRLRHAYSVFTWPQTKLLFGRTWHPTFVEKVFPGVLALNTGSPFQVFNRSPQIRLTHTLSKGWDLIAAAVYQINYTNFGPDPNTGLIINSSRFQRDAVIPNLHLQGQFYNDHWVAGIGLDWKIIQPRDFTVGEGGKKYVTSEKLETWAALAYLKYTKGKLEVKAKSMYGQNVSESLLPGGYAVASRDPVTGFETYTPTNHTFNFINMYYGETWKAGIFLGYLKNLGTSQNPAGLFCARCADVDVCYRISPQLTWKYKNFMATWEPDITSVSYGRIDYQDKGRVKDASFVTNYRSLFSILYMF